MFLQKIKLHGFKSFAQPTTLDFTSPLTAIVGPNGSGKSNIVDAVRWVMGEQSPTALRGSRMADVIFSGSKHNSPMKKASVSLQLDNSQGQLDLKEEEVTITREVVQSGNSSYYLNGESCRLKDVEEVLYDTGLSRESYSIVGQNRVEAIIKSRPEKLRELFEEAAGITRYRKRKEEAEKKLARTSRDLERVNDLIEEIKRRITPLKAEAEKAKKYKKLYDRLKELECSYLCSRLKKIEKDVQSLLEKESNIEKKKNKAEQKLSDKREERNELKTVYNDHKNQQQEIKDRGFTLKARLQEIDNNLEILQERENNIKEDKARISQEKEEIAEQQSSLYADLQNTYTQLEETKAELGSQKHILADVLQALENNAKEKLLLQGQRGEYSLEEINSKTTELQNSLLTIKERKEAYLRDVERINRNLDELQAQSQKIKQQRDKLEQQLKGKTNKLEKINQQLLDLKNEEEKLKEKKEKVSQKIDRLQQAYSRYRSRWQAHKKMQQQGEGYYQGVKAVLTNKSLQGILGPVAELLTVPQKYERAISTALGSRLQNIVVKRDKEAQRAIAFLKKEKAGRATFLPLDMIEGHSLDLDNLALPKGEDFIGLALELVTFDKEITPVVEYLLGRVLVTETLDSATDIARRTNKRYKIVTTSGEIINPGGAITGGSSRNKSAALLARSRKIEDLARAGQKSRQQLQDKKSQLAELKKEQEKLQQTRQKVSGKKQDLLQEINSWQAKIESQQVKIKEIGDREKSLQEEKDDIKSKIDRLIQRQDAQQERLSYFQQLLREEKEKSAKIDKKIAHNIRKNKSLASFRQEEELKVARFEEKKNSLLREINKLEQRQSELEQKVDKLEEEEEEIKRRNNKLKKRRLELKDKEEITTKELKTNKEEQEVIASRVDNLAAELDALITELEELEEQKNELQQQRHSCQLKKGKLEAKKERITGRLEDRYDLSYEEALAQYEPSLSEEDPGEEISQLEKKIRALGEVNLGAIKQHKNLKERYEFLSQEKEDLLQARESIQGVIAEIEDKMGELFYETFNLVKEHFKEIFQQLFDGGEAKLSLTDRDDLLSSGVEIIARPPGKKLSKLTLLSGGEKALTAIALIFAFLKVKPSPFYLLDEIDSPLDEANLHKFANFIRKYLDHSQFILITHRKQMMAVADTIYGVTMAESGVSRLVSLQLEEEEEEMVVS